MTEENSTSTGQTGGVPSESQTTEQPKEKSFTQADLNAAIAEEKRQWQAKLKELKSKADEWDKLQEASKSELEKLKAELAEKDALLQSKDQELSSLKLERVKAAKLAEAGVAAEWIDSVSGTTEEEVAASVTKLAARLKVEPPKAAQGAGQTGIQNQEKKNTKIWTQSEIKELRLSGRLTDEVMAEIKQATAEGRVQ